MKTLCLHNVDIHKKFLKILSVKQIILKFYDNPIRPLMTFEVILHFMKNLRLLNVSIHRKFCQNRFINEEKN